MYYVNFSYQINASYDFQTGGFGVLLPDLTLDVCACTCDTGIFVFLSSHILMGIHICCSCKGFCKTPRVYPIELSPLTLLIVRYRCFVSH